MLIDEFLIALGVKADTAGLDQAEDGLRDVASQAERTDKKLSGFTSKLSAGIKTFAGFAIAAAGAIKGVMVGAWAYLDSTIDRVEELQNAEDKSLRTTKEQVDMAKKYRENMDKMGKTIESVKMKVALAFLPTMYELSKQYATLIDSNKDLIANGISKFLAIVGKAAQVITNFIKFIKLAIESTIGWKGALIAIGVAFAYVNRAMLLAFATNPIAWVMVAIAGLLLLIDDFMVYLKGGESEFGKYWGVLIAWVDKAKGAWANFSDSAKSSIKAVAIAIGMLAGSSVIISTMTKVFSILGAVLKVILSPIRILFSALGLLAKGVVLAGKAFMVAGRMMLANPMVLVAVAVGLVVYAIIDLIKWIRTGESSFGGFWQACADVWNNIVSIVSSAIESVINYVSSMLDSIISTVSGIIEAFVNAWNSVTQATQSAFDSITSFFTSLFNIWVGMISSVVAGIGSAFSGVFDIITAPFAKAFDWVSEKWNGLKAIFSSGVNVNANMATASASPVQRTINNNSTTNASINVNGAGSPQAVANNVQKNLNSTASKNQGGRAKA